MADIARKYLNPLNNIDELSNYQYEIEEKRPREELLGIVEKSKKAAGYGQTEYELKR